MWRGVGKLECLLNICMFLLFIFSSNTLFYVNGMYLQIIMLQHRTVIKSN